VDARSKPEIAVLALGAALTATVVGIGAASGEMLRHVVQATPAAVLTLVALRRPGWERWLLGPTFAFWLLIAACIGLFLAGLPSPITGTFNPAERALTLTLAVLAVAAFVQFLRIRRPRPMWAGVLFALVALGLQVGALVLSLEAGIAHR
jgi:hypothetical protein